MSKIYSATNNSTGAEVTMYENTIKGGYEIVIRGSKVVSIMCNWIADAYREYNAALR